MELRLQLNLQFFAKDGPGGEKTEEPTSKKLEDARKEGQVAKSKDIGNAFGILALFLILKIYIGSMGTRFLELFSAVYGQIPSISTLYSGNLPIAALQVLIKSMMLQMIIIAAPIFLVGVVVAFVCDVAQVKWRPTSKPMQPKFSKLNPMKGFARIFSPGSLVELLKSVLKLAVIGYMVYSYLKGRIGQIFLLYDISIGQAIELIGDVVIELGIRIAAVYMIIAMLDYAYQKYKFKQDMKMTKQEVKDEYKNTEDSEEEFEGNSTLKLTDDMAIEKIKTHLKIDNLIEIQNFSNRKRDETIRKINEIKGIERKQLARILGLNERTIYRAIK